MPFRLRLRQIAHDRLLMLRRAPRARRATPELSAARHFSLSFWFFFMKPLITETSMKSAAAVFAAPR